MIEKYIYHKLKENKDAIPILVWVVGIVLCYIAFLVYATNVIAFLILVAWVVAAPVGFGVYFIMVFFQKILQDYRRWKKRMEKP